MADVVVWSQHAAVGLRPRPSRCSSTATWCSTAQQGLRPSRLRAGHAAARGGAPDDRAGRAGRWPCRWPPPAEALAIEHARIHAGDGKAIDDGTLVVRGGAVAALGPAAAVTVPAGARRIDGKGLWLTPGLVDAESSTGLADVYMEKSTVEIGLDDSYDAIRAAFQVIDGFNPRAVAIPITRLEGVTGTVHRPQRRPGRRGGARPCACSARACRTWWCASPVAVYAQMGRSGREAGWGTHGGQLMRLRELLDDVRQYARRRGDFERNQMRKVAASRLDLEALIPVVEGRLPLVVEVNRAADIQAVLRLGREEKLDLVLTGCEEGWLVAADIAAAKVPVMVSAAGQPAPAVRGAVGPPGQRRPAGEGRREAGPVARAAAPTTSAARCAWRRATPSPTACPGRPP